jgi:hypothetical protein
MPYCLLTTERGRRRVVDAALALTHNTHLSPPPHERSLLELFVQSTLTIDQVLDQLEQAEHSPEAELLS